MYGCSVCRFCCCRFCWSFWSCCFCSCFSCFYSYLYLYLNCRKSNNSQRAQYYYQQCNSQNYQKHFYTAYSFFSKCDSGPGGLGDSKSRKIYVRKQWIQTNRSRVSI